MIYFNYTPTQDDEQATILWDSVLSGVTASSTAVGTLASSVLTTSTYDYWEATSATASLTFDLGSAKDLDSFALVGHNLGSTGADLVISGSSDGVTYTPLITVSPVDDTTILALIEKETYRYWRLSFSGGSDAPKVSVVMGGMRFTMPGWVMPPYTPIWQAQTVELLVSQTLGGQFVGNRLLRQGASTSINLTAFETDFVETTLQPFRKHYNEGNTFVWAAAPGVFLNDVGYCWRSGSEMKPSFDNNGSWMSLSMEVMGYVN